MIRFMFSRVGVIGIALGAFFALGGATAARADNGRSCEKKIAHEQRNLDKAIARHGYYRWQANEERRELNRLYERCGRRDRDQDRDRDEYRNYYRDRD
jgi:hypothetical protein